MNLLGFPLLLVEHGYDYIVAVDNSYRDEDIKDLEMRLCDTFHFSKFVVARGISQPRILVEEQCQP